MNLKITEAERAAAAVSALPTRPNSSQNGSGGMSSRELRAAFDALPNLLCARFNALLEALGQTDDGGFAAALATPLVGADGAPLSLRELLCGLADGSFAARLWVGGESLASCLSRLADVAFSGAYADLSGVPVPVGSLAAGDQRTPTADAVKSYVDNAIAALDSSVEGEAADRASALRAYAEQTAATAESNARSYADRVLAAAHAYIDGHTVSSPALTESEDGCPCVLTAEDNHSYRTAAVLAADGRYRFELVLPALGAQSSFMAQLTLATCPTEDADGEATVLSVSYPDGLDWCGDDVADGAFIPRTGMRYFILFYYDGFDLHAAVRGVEA